MPQIASPQPPGYNIPLNKTWLNIFFLTNLILLLEPQATCCLHCHPAPLAQHHRRLLEAGVWLQLLLRGDAQWDGCSSGQWLFIPGMASILKSRESLLPFCGTLPPPEINEGELGSNEWWFGVLRENKSICLALCKLILLVVNRHHGRV